VTGDGADLQAQFSIAYVQAVASVAGFFVQHADRGFDKDGIDLSVLRRGALGLTTSTRLDLQVKSYSGDAQGDPWPYDLEVRSYSGLIRTDYQVPRILVVVRVPADAAEWISHGEEQLVLRRCGYWLSLRGAVLTTNTSTIRVQIPRAHILDAAALGSLMRQVAEGVAP
jgi:hypothetical protein